MKKIVVYFFVLFSPLLYSQTILTQTFNEPKPGDLENTYELDTVAFVSGLPLNITGSAAVWDFSQLKVLTPLFDNYYLNAASDTSSPNYPGCTLVEVSNNLTSYFKSTSTPIAQTELLGLKSNTLTINFTNSSILVKYPVSYGSSSTDNLSGTFTASLSGTCSGAITTTADAQGTLTLPAGMVLTNVLRVKSVQTITLTAGFFPLGVLKHTVYNYFHSSQKFPVLSITYDYLTSILTPTPSLIATVMGNTDYFLTGLNEKTLKSSAVNLFPNPAQSLLSIDIGDFLLVTEIKLYNQLGEVVLEPEISLGAQKIFDVSALKSGIYFVEVGTQSGILRKKLIKE